MILYYRSRYTHMETYSTGHELEDRDDKEAHAVVEFGFDEQSLLGVSCCVVLIGSVKTLDHGQLLYN